MEGPCAWASNSEITARYHAEEWGVPVKDDRRQFEFLMLEAMQCGLSWDIVMKKREVLRRAFAGFDFAKVAAFGAADVERILAMPGMIRSRRKIEAVIHNAGMFIAVREAFGSFTSYIWGFTGGKTLVYKSHAAGDIPPSNELSAGIAADLRKRGFKYLGPVTVYAHLQACGMINDHVAACPRHAAINAIADVAVV